MAKKNSGITFFNIIFDHLQVLSELAYGGRDINLSVDSLWSMLKPYIDDQLMSLWRTKTRQQNYDGMLWKIRICMLTLYKIEALPASNTDQEKLVFGEYEPPRKEQDKGMVVSGEILFKQLMMKHYYLRKDLVAEGIDLNSMQYMADLGYYYCSPYITWEDREKWQEANNQAQFNEWQWFNEKISIVSAIMDREGLQFSRRAIDVVEPQSLRDIEEEVEPFEEEAVDLTAEEQFRRKK